MADNVKWLKRLITELGEKTKEEVVSEQEGLEGKLRSLLGGELGPAGRRLLGRAFVVMYERGNILGLHGMVGRCCDVLKSKDEGQSPTNSKQNVLVVLGTLYEGLGLMAGSSYMEVVQILAKVAKQPEYRVDVLVCVTRVVRGMGQSSSSAHKDITRLFRGCLTDRTMEVRKAATECGVALATANPFLCTQELESTAALCFKAVEGSTDVVRCGVAGLLGQLLIGSQQALPPHQKGKAKQMGVQEALGILAQGFTKGSGGLFKGSGGELLKTGIGGASSEVRVTVTQAYVLFLRGMGPHWVERNAPVLLRHILDLLSSTKVVSTHIGAVYARNCVQFILGEAFVRMLRESVQLYVARLLCSMAQQSIARGDGLASGEVEKKVTPVNNQNELVCVLMCVGQLVVKLNTAALPLVVGDSSSLAPDGSNAGPLLELVMRALVHTNLSVRLAAAWCLRCVAGTLQTQLTALLDLCLGKLSHFRGAADAISGYSSAVAALLASARQSQLGLHTSKIKLVLVSAEELLSSSDDSQKLSASLSQAAWTMIGACCTTGSALLKPHLGTVVHLWRETFPRSMKELSVEQTQGGSESLFAVIERRAGALASMGHLIKHCSELVDEQVLKRVLVSVNSTVAMLGSKSSMLKTPLAELNAKMALLRLRLYQTLICLPPASFEGCLSGILRELVGEFTLSTNVSATTTSMLRTLFDVDMGMVLEAWSRETDQQALEQQLQPYSAAGAGALEHDPHTLFTHEGDQLPGPLPLGVAVIDASVLLFGRVFPRVSQSHRQQLLNHFLPALKQGKSQKQLAIQINIFSACLCAFKNLVATKDSLGGHEVTSTAHDIVQLALSSPDQTVRCVGGEALGRLAQVCGGGGQVALVQRSFDLLKTSRDISLRTGHSLGLGCVHRCLGAVGAGQHIGMSVALLLALAKDNTASVCQVWALFALALIVDSGGPLFRTHTESALQGVGQLLLTTPFQEVGVYRCLGRCLNSLITSLGPELQLSSGSISEVRAASLLYAEVLLDHPDPFVQAAGLNCLQQLQVYAPQFVDLDKTVRSVCAAFSDPAVVLRRTVANCLRQFSQLEPAGVRRVASAALGGDLEQLVVRRLDWEVHEGLVEDLKEVLLSLLSSLAPQDPMHWLQFCNRLLSASSEGKPLDLPGEGADEEDEEAGALHKGQESEGEREVAPNWQTRLFAMELVRKVYSSCRSNPAHFDQTLATKQRQQTGGDFLVFHLSDLVRTSFLAATSDVLQLRVGGYQALGEVIGLFAHTPDPDYPDHSLLELYQAQIGAALRPAFTADTPPHLTAIACQVCSQWLACGVSGDVGDLSRVQQLLVTSLQRIQRGGGAQSEVGGAQAGGGAEGSRDTQFGEAVATLESLAVLRAWAELYIKISQDSDPQQQEKGTELVQGHLGLLSKNWLAAVRDYALISLPPQFTSQLPSRGTFFTLDTVDSVRCHYKDCWHVLLHATTLWQSGRGHLAREPSSAPVPEGQFSVPLEGDTPRDVFYLLLGLVVQALCDASVLEADPVIRSLMLSLHTLLSSTWARSHMSQEEGVAVEALSVLHRLLLTCKKEGVHLAALKTARLVADCLTAAPPPTPHSAGLAKVLMRIASCSLMEYLPLHQDGRQKAPAASREAQDLLSASVNLLPTVLQLSPVDEVAGNAPAVLYLLLMAIAQPPIYSACGAAVLTALKAALAAATDPAPLVLSCLAALMENQPTAPVDLTALGCELKLVVLATLLLTPGVAITGEVPQISSAVDYITSSYSEETKPAVLTRVVRTCCLLLEGKPPAENAYLVCRLVPCLVGVVSGAVQQGQELTREGAGLALQATQGIEGVCLAPDTDQRLAEQYFAILFSLLGEGPPKGVGQYALHTFAIQRLKDLGPLHIAAMRSVVLADPQKKARLERALQTGSSLPSATTGQQKTPATAAPRAPAITLRQDFSNFAF